MPRFASHHVNGPLVPPTGARPTEHVVLMGGPCSGQTHRVRPGTPTLTAHDPDGGAATYVRTDLTTDDGDTPYRVYRQEAAPAAVV